MSKTQTPPHTKRKSKTVPSNSPWQIVGVMAIIVGFALILTALINLRTIQKYRKDGLSAEALITDKWKGENDTCIEVSYFDKDLFEGGQLHLTVVCDFVTDQIWQTARKGGHEFVIFLPENPEENTIFAAALENSPWPTLNIGVILLILGVLASGWQWIRKQRTG